MQKFVIFCGLLSCGFTLACVILGVLVYAGVR